jgi:hypothetical protein
MKEFIAEVTLRKPYEVYRVGDEYQVERNVRPGTTYVTKAPKSHVERLAKLLMGRTTGTDEVANAIRSSIPHDDLPYAYGYKLRFYAQSALIVLVALGIARKVKEGRRFLYSVGGQPRIGPFD